MERVTRTAKISNDLYKICRLCLEENAEFQINDDKTVEKIEFTTDVKVTTRTSE